MVSESPAGVVVLARPPQFINLMQQCVPPDKNLLDQAYQKGNVMIRPADVPNELNLVITNYLKPEDSMTLVFDRQKKQLPSIAIGSYLDDRSDAVKLNVQFSSLPDGTHLLSSSMA